MKDESKYVRVKMPVGLPYDGHYKFRNVEELGTTSHFDWFKTWYVCKEQPWICAEID